MAQEVFAIESGHPQAAAIESAARALAEGGLVLFPSDTCYIVGSLARVGMQVSAGIDRLLGFKSLRGGPSFPWLVSDPDRLDIYGTEISDEARTLAAAFWPGALTLVVKASAAVPRSLVRRDGAIGLRVSTSPIVSALLHTLERPIVTTGARVPGAPNPLSFDQVDPRIVEAADVVIDGGSADCQGRSTIVNCSHGPAHILREGIIAREDIDAALGYRTPLV